MALRHSPMPVGDFCTGRSTEGIDTMNKDQVKGRLQEAKGKIKEVAGKVTGDEKTQVKGNIEKNVGRARATMGDVREDVKKTLDR